MEIEIKTVVKELNELFDIENNIEKGSYLIDNEFAISKTHFSRDEVLHKLQEYFTGKKIKGGYLKVDSITFVHTSFEVFEGHPNN